MAAWDVYRPQILGRCEHKTGIRPFERLVRQVGPKSPTVRRRCSGSSTTRPLTLANAANADSPASGPPHRRLFGGDRQGEASEGRRRDRRTQRLATVSDDDRQKPSSGAPTVRTGDS